MCSRVRGWLTRDRDGPHVPPSTSFSLQAPPDRRPTLPELESGTIEAKHFVPEASEQPSKSRGAFWKRFRKTRDGNHQRNRKHQSSSRFLSKLLSIVCCCRRYSDCCGCCSSPSPSVNEWCSPPPPLSSTRCTTSPPITITTTPDTSQVILNNQHHSEQLEVNDNLNETIINRLLPLHREGEQSLVGERHTHTINQTEDGARFEVSVRAEPWAALPSQPVSVTTYVDEPSTSASAPSLDLAKFVNAKLSEPSSAGLSVSRSKIVPYINEMKPRTSYMLWKKTQPNTALVSHQIEISSKRLMKEIADLMRKQQIKREEPPHNINDDDRGLPFSIELINDSLYEWNIHIHRFDSDSQIESDMREHDIASIVLQASFPQAYPFEPPFVRVVKPYIERGYVMEGGAICLELLTRTGWTSAYTMEAVIYQLMASFIKGQARIKPHKDASKCFSKKSAENSFRHIVRIHDKHGWVDTPLYEG